MITVSDKVRVVIVLIIIGVIVGFGVLLNVNHNLRKEINQLEKNQGKLVELLKSQRETQTKLQNAISITKEAPASVETFSKIVDSLFDK